MAVNEPVQEAQETEQVPPTGPAGPSHDDDDNDAPPPLVSDDADAAAPDSTPTADTDDGDADTKSDKDSDDESIDETAASEKVRRCLSTPPPRHTPYIFLLDLPPASHGLPARASLIIPHLNSFSLLLDTVSGGRK